MILADAAQLQPQLLKDCANREIETWIALSPIRWGFVSDISKRAILGNFSAGFAFYEQQPAFLKLKTEYMSSGLTCGDLEEESDTEPIHANQMMGIFVIFYSAL